MRVIEMFVRRPVIAIVVNLALVLIGLRAVTQLPIQQYPRIESSSIVITTVYVGASAESIRGFVTTPPLRRREIESYWKRLAKDLPTIIAGDFNEDTSGSAIGFLTKQGLSRVDTTGPKTWHYEIMSQGKMNDLLKLDIDHVMVNSRLTAHGGVVLDEGASDHRPVVVTIEPRA